MSDRPSHNHSGLDLDLARQIDEVCRRFKAAWREGHQPRIDDYLVAVSHEGRPALRSELEAPERELRRSEGILPRPEAGSATTPEPRPAPPRSTVAEAPTMVPGVPPTAPLPGAAPTDLHEDLTLPPREEATVDHVSADSARCRGAGPDLLLRRLRDRPRAGVGRHGRRLPGATDQPQSPRGAQDDPRRPARPRDVARVVRPRGRGRRQTSFTHFCLPLRHGLEARQSGPAQHAGGRARTIPFIQAQRASV